MHETIVIFDPGNDDQHWVNVPREYYRLPVTRHLVMRVRGR